MREPSAAGRGGGFGSRGTNVRSVEKSSAGARAFGSALSVELESAARPCELPAGAPPWPCLELEAESCVRWFEPDLLIELDAGPIRPIRPPILLGCAAAVGACRCEWLACEWAPSGSLSSRVSILGVRASSPIRIDPPGPRLLNPDTAFILRGETGPKCLTCSEKCGPTPGGTCDRVCRPRRGELKVVALSAEPGKARAERVRSGEAAAQECTRSSSWQGRQVRAAVLGYSDCCGM